MARTAGIKVKVKTKLERILTIPADLEWTDGAILVLRKKSESDWALAPQTEEPAPAA